MKDKVYHNIAIGLKGEKIASEFLMSRGYKIIEKNFTSPFGEIDLIALKNGVLTFFEVKTRVTERFGPPLAAINKTKIKHIIKTCEYYLLINNNLDIKCSIDLISIKLDTNRNMQVLKHIKNAIIKE